MYLWLFQNVFTGRHEGCGHDSSLEVSNELVHTGIKMFLPGSTPENLYPHASGSVVQTPPGLGVPNVDKIDPSLQENNGFDPLIPGLTTTPLEPHHHYSAEELSMAVATSCVCALVVGFITGFLMSRRCSCSAREDDNPYHVPYLTQLVFVLPNPFCM